jgi:hypothetical protein
VWHAVALVEYRQLLASSGASLRAQTHHMDAQPFNICGKAPAANDLVGFKEGQQYTICSAGKNPGRISASHQS